MKDLISIMLEYLEHVQMYLELRTWRMLNVKAWTTRSRVDYTLNHCLVIKIL